jgi:dihydrofolate reductase
MIINSILAHDDNYGIGKKGQLPWPKNSTDMKWFRDNTIGHVVVMGRKTWESIGSKPLKNRINIVVSNQKFINSKEGKPDHVISFVNGNYINTILSNLYPDSKIWIIGGANIYSQTLLYCDNIYVTKIPGNYDCDTFIHLNKYLINYTEIFNKNKDGLTFSIWRKNCETVS